MTLPYNRNFEARNESSRHSRGAMKLTAYFKVDSPRRLDDSIQVNVKKSVRNVLFTDSTKIPFDHFGEDGMERVELLKWLDHLRKKHVSNGLVPFFGRTSVTPSIYEVISFHENVMTSTTMAIKKDARIKFKGKDEQFIILVCNENTCNPRIENSVESTYQIMFDSFLSDVTVFAPARMSSKKHSFTTSSRILQNSRS